MDDGRDLLLAGLAGDVRCALGRLGAHTVGDALRLQGKAACIEASQRVPPPLSLQARAPSPATCCRGAPSPAWRPAKLRGAAAGAATCAELLSCGPTRPIHTGSRALNDLLGGGVFLGQVLEICARLGVKGLALAWSELAQLPHCSQSRRRPLIRRSHTSQLPVLTLSFPSPHPSPSQVATRAPARRKSGARGLQ